MKLVVPLFLITFLFLALVPIIGIEVKGAKRWIDFHYFRLQPIEILKPFFVLMTAWALTNEKLQNSQIRYLLSFLLLGAVIILLIDPTGSWPINSFSLQLGCDCFYIWCEFIIYNIFLFFFMILGLLLFFLPEKFGYVINRLITFINPSQGDKFQSSSALDAIKLGGLTGQGMGEGILKESVPEAHTDYVIAVISEEFGSIASIIILIIFLYISFRIIKNCFNQDNQFLKISLSGLAALLIFQTFIHAELMQVYYQQQA